MKQQAIAKEAVPEMNTPSSVLAQLNEIDSFVQKLVGIYKDLVEYTNDIVATKCANLRTYIVDLRCFYFDKVKSILSGYQYNKQSINFFI